ncbi:unnamed protein product [Leptidea sinapis]|uniref:Protein krueppel n=1 Tax=Leptidea sinapis TaxID=189913 RepID=A0A5E4R9T5_9NEOP|nr:unnamed protein product [Leptidea sinapis]
MSRRVDIKALVSHLVRKDGSNNCRICMGSTSDGMVFLGDTVMELNGIPTTLADVFEKISGLRMFEEDLLPLGICHECSVAAISAYEFSNFVVKSDKLWNNAISSLTVVPVSKPHSKSLCAILKDNLSLQLIKNFDGNSRHLLNYLNPIKKNATDTLRKNKASWNGISYSCEDCGKEFSSSYYLNMHLKNSGQKELCWICIKMVNRGQEMKDHLANIHKINMFLCKDCPILTKTESELKQHRKTCHISGVFTCSQCGRSFHRLNSFELHGQMHAVRTCRACGLQFTNRGCYREHRSKCEPDAKPDPRTLPKNKRSNIRDLATFICDYCSKIYHKRAQLQNHIKWIHMDVRPHQCQWCGKRFYTSARLAEHTVVHTRARNFSCDICGLRLVSKMAVVYHRRRHTGEKPYECKDCGERFISSSRRSEHARRKHDGPKYQCTLCTSSFARSFDLRKHINKAHWNPKSDPADDKETPAL